MKYCVDCGAKNKNSAAECIDCGCQNFSYECARCGALFENLPRCPTCGLRAGQPRHTCPECGEEYYSKTCPTCGYERGKEMIPAAKSSRTAPAGKQSKTHRAGAGLTCSRCGSHNVNVQIAATKQSHSHRGCLWSIGRFFLIFFTCGLWLLIGRSAGKSKIKNDSFAVCQDCGYKWKVK